MPEIDNNPGPAAPRPPLPSEEKSATWAELFFDLVFVFAVTRTSVFLQEHDTLSGIAQAFVVFIPAYWTWVGATIHANIHNVDSTRDRVGRFAVGFCGLLVALALPQAFEQHAVLFAGAYWAGRLILLALVHGQPHRHAFTSFTVAAVLSAPLLVVGAVLGGSAQIALWVAAAAVDLGTPIVVRRRLSAVPFETSHLAERYGTFVIIALGEAVVAIGSGAVDGGATPIQLVSLGVAYLAVAGLWWVYFAFSSEAIRTALSHAENRIDLIRPVLSYGHLGFVAGIVGFAAAAGHAVAEPSANLPSYSAGLLFGGAALYLGTFAFTRWQMFHSLSWTRLAAAAGCVVAGLAATRMPALASLSVLAVVLVILNIAEDRIIPQGLRGLTFVS